VFLNFLVVGLGGFLGSCLRFAFTRLCEYYGIEFPLGTLLSNVVAGIAIGFVIGLEISSPKTKLFLTTGLLGGLSTFSTFSLETINLYNDGKYLLSTLNVLLNLGLSLFGVILGMFMAKIIFSKA